MPRPSWCYCCCWRCCSGRPEPIGRHLVALTCRIGAAGTKVSAPFRSVPVQALARLQCRDCRPPRPKHPESAARRDPHHRLWRFLFVDGLRLDRAPTVNGQIQALSAPRIHDAITTGPAGPRGRVSGCSSGVSALEMPRRLGRGKRASRRLAPAACPLTVLVGASIASHAAGAGYQTKEQ